MTSTMQVGAGEDLVEVAAAAGQHAADDAGGGR